MDNLEQIEAWLSGELSEAERAAFEQKMEADPAFAAEVDMVRSLIKGVRRAGARDFAKQIEAELEAENFFDAPPQPADVEQPKAKPRLNWLLVAAGIALVVGVGLWAFWPGDDSSLQIIDPNGELNGDPNEIAPPGPIAAQDAEDKDTAPSSPAAKPPARKQLLDAAFAAHYIPEQNNLPNVIDRLEGRGLAAQSREYRTELAGALALYQDSSYAEARSALSAFLAAHPDEGRARLYLGLTELALGQSAEAAATLAPLIQDKDFAYRQTARWYLALAYAKQGKEEQAAALMQVLADDAESGYHEQAKQFLDALKKQ
jgi:hypothetical protein